MIWWTKIKRLPNDLMLDNWLFLNNVTTNYDLLYLKSLLGLICSYVQRYLSVHEQEHQMCFFLIPNFSGGTNWPNVDVWNVWRMPRVLIIESLINKGNSYKEKWGKWSNMRRTISVCWLIYEDEGSATSSWTRPLWLTMAKHLIIMWRESRYYQNSYFYSSVHKQTLASCRSSQLSRQNLWRWWDNRGKLQLAHRIYFGKYFI